MCAKTVRNLALVVCFFTFGIAFSFAQAVFTISSLPGTAADIGYAEPAGPIVLTVSSGTTIAAPVQITYSAPITNNSASDISVTGSGHLVGINLHPTLDRTGNSILINVPASGTRGDQISVSGVRVALAGLNVSQVTGSVSSPTPVGNSFLAGTLQPIVISSIMQPFSIDQSVAPPLSFSSSGDVINSPTTFIIAEKYATAFSSSIGIGGQTVATRILIRPFPADLPAGVQITFPATVLTGSGTGAVFRTLSGGDETIPRQDGSKDVTYEFTSGVGSSTTVESFGFSASMTSTIRASGTIQFQAELLPTGSLDDALPANIPRYAERLVPNESDLTTGSGTTELIFPFRAQSDATYTGIAITNPSSYKINATLTAYDAAGQVISGTGITNPVPKQIDANGHYYAVASNIFGSAFNASSPGVILVTAQNPGLKGIYMTGDISGPKLDGGVGDAQSSKGWYLPVVFHQGTAPFNRLEIYNPGTSAAQLSLKLMDANGTQVTTTSRTLDAGAFLSGDLTEIFGISLSSFQGGYIKGEADNPLIATGNFGNALESNVLGAQGSVAVTSYFIPHFASGDQYSTELTLVNLDSSVVNLTLTLLNDSGTAITDPVSVPVNPGAQQVKTIAALFPSLGSHLVTGSIKVLVNPVFHGFFPSFPTLLGAVRYSNVDGSASSSVPFAMASSTDFVCSHIAENTGYFTGLAMVNSDTNPANFTLKVYKDDGSSVGTYSSQLQPGQRISKLIHELVPAAAGQLGGYFRITSDAALTGFAAFASSDLRSMCSIPLELVK